MRMMRGAVSVFAVAAMAVTLAACPPPEREPAAFEEQDTLPPAESPGDPRTQDPGTDRR